MRRAVRRAMVLAAGRGTRLAPLTDERPKPLFPLGPFPILHYPLLMLRSAGIAEVMVNLHHHGEQIRAWFGDGRGLGLEIRYSEEHPDLLGTGGGVRKARPFLDGAPFVLLNGDTLVDVDLSRVLDAHAESGAAATMVLVDADPEAGYGLVSVDADERVRDIAGRTGWKGPAARQGNFCGVHVIEPRVFDAMPDRNVFCINADVYPRLLAAGDRIHACFLAGGFSDVGTPARYLKTAGDLLDGTLRLRYLGDANWCADSSVAEREPGLWVAGTARLDPAATLKPPAFVGDGAVVEAGATFGPYAVLCREGRAGRGSRVSHTIVWEDAAVAEGEALHGSVVTPLQRLRIDLS